MTDEKQKISSIFKKGNMGNKIDRLLSQISMIAKQTNINMTIPQNTLKELPSK